MKKEAYLFDTHALVFWNNKETVSGKFINFLITKCKKVVFMFLSFDRLLIVQANQNMFPIVTKDRVAGLLTCGSGLPGMFQCFQGRRIIDIVVPD